MKRFLDFLDYLLPLYEEEGKAYLRVGVGCTGGRHRSVAVGTELARRLTDLVERPVHVQQRDMERVAA